MSKAKNTSYEYKMFEKLCKEQGLTPYQVSNRTNGVVSTTVLSQWKQNDYVLKLDKLRALAKAFDVPVTVFIET